MIRHLTDDKELFYIQACLGYRLFPDERLPEPPAGLDWSRLLTLLTRQRLAAYFYTLRLSLGSDWPEEFCHQLHAVRLMLLLYGDQCAGRIKTVLSTLRNSEVDVIVLKGWAFIQTIYEGDHSVRFCEDIDLLVRPQDSRIAAGLLRGLGYQPVAESWPDYHQRYSNDQVYYLINEPKIFNRIFTVGFHWGLIHKPISNPDQVDINALFSRAWPLEVAGTNVLELSIEDQIVYGCAHLGLHHEYEEALYRYYEIGALIRRGGSDLDWNAMIQRAREWQCIIPLQRVLAYLECLWPNLTPAAVLEEIKVLSPVFLERFVNWWIEKTRGRPSFDHLLTWIITPSLRQRFEIAFQDIFPSPKYMRKRYGPAPAGIWPIIYFRRLLHSFRLMGKSHPE